MHSGDQEALEAARVKIRNQLAKQCGNKERFEAAWNNIVKNALSLSNCHQQPIKSQMRKPESKVVKQKTKKPWKWYLVGSGVILGLAFFVAATVITAQKKRQEKCNTAKVHLDYELNEKAEWQESCDNMGYALDGSSPAIDACMEKYHYSKVREEENNILMYCSPKSPVNIRLRIKLGRR